MLIQITLTEQAKCIIEDLRINHIDAQLIIQEELVQTLPEYIEVFLRASMKGQRMVGIHYDNK